MILRLYQSGPVIRKPLRWDTLQRLVLDNSDMLYFFFFQFPIVKNYFKYETRSLNTLHNGLKYRNCANPVMQRDAPGLLASMTSSGSASSPTPSKAIPVQYFYQL